MKGVRMRSFDYSRLYEKAWDTDILNLVAKIHECKGRQDLFIRQKPVELTHGDHTERYCRNGEEIGDKYTCTYGCPVF